ncbi:hypothetical protein H0H93_013617 [Arthromyces matolae]|nr:hypothetical protein H0H93_013617 [Arthromyces matolae]
MTLSRSGFSSRSSDSDDQLMHDRVALAFIALQLIGGCGLLIIMVTAAIGREIKRHSTWYSFVASWIVSSISYTLLAFAGQRTGPIPDFGLCLIQGALIYAAPTLTGCTTLALVLHMLLNLRRLLANAPFRTSSFAVAALLILPWLVWLSIPDIPSTAGVIGVRLYQNRRIISGSGQSITMVIRVMIFSLLGALALGLVVVVLVDQLDVDRNLTANHINCSEIASPQAGLTASTHRPIWSLSLQRMHNGHSNDIKE